MAKFKASKTALEGHPFSKSANNPIYFCFTNCQRLNVGKISSLNVGKLVVAICVLPYTLLSPLITDACKWSDPFSECLIRLIFSPDSSFRDDSWCLLGSFLGRYLLWVHCSFPNIGYFVGLSLYQWYSFWPFGDLLLLSSLTGIWVLTECHLCCLFFKSRMALTMFLVGLYILCLPFLNSNNSIVLPPLAWFFYYTLLYLIAFQTLPWFPSFTDVACRGDRSIVQLLLNGTSTCPCDISWLGEVIPLWADECPIYEASFLVSAAVMYLFWTPLSLSYL